MRVPAEVALEGGESDCRNRTLHELFLLIGQGERAGSGVPKIHQGWAAQGHSLSLFDSTEPFEQTVMTLTWGASDEETTQETTQETAKKFSQKQREILAYLKSHPTANRKELAENMDGITENGIKYNLKVLQEQGWIVRIGSTKAGYWEVKE